MDNFALEALIQEITPALLQSRIQKIKRIGETGFALGLRSRTNESLVISLERSFPTLFLTDESIPPQGDASDWLLTLRKHLAGGKILGLHKNFSERKVLVELETYRHSSLPVRSYLLLELIPAKSNAFLLNESREVLASFRTGLAQAETKVGTREFHHNSYQAIDRITETDFHQLVQACGGLGNGSVAANRTEQVNGSYGPMAMFRSKSAHVPMKLAGMSRYFIQEVLHGDCNDPSTLWERFQRLLERVQQGPYWPQVYFIEGLKESSKGPEHPKESSRRGRTIQPLISPFPLDSLRGVEHAEFLSLNAAVANAYQFVASRTSFRASQKSQVRRVDVLLRKKNRLLKNLQEDLKKSEGVEICKKYADLIYAKNDKSPPGQKRLRLIDLFDPDQREIEVSLNPKLSLIQNAVLYSKLYQKARRSIPLITARIKRTEQEIEHLVDQERSLTSATKVGELLDVASTSQGYKTVRRKMKKSAEAGLIDGRETRLHSKVASENLIRRTAKSFISSEGMVILVGKSSKDNDTLTLKIAQSDDFWLHVASYGGSHVVLKNPEKLAVPPRQSLLEAAQLAAYFSQARNASKVEVHYTKRKFVSKPRGAKPGLVQLRDHKSVSVRPELLLPHPV